MKRSNRLKPALILGCLLPALLFSGCAKEEPAPAATAAPTEAIAAWTSLARTYSGEPARKLVNGVLGTALREVAVTAEIDGGSNS